MDERCPHGFRTDGSTNCPFCLNDDWMPVAKDQCHPVTGTPDAAQGIEALAGGSVWERPHLEDCVIYRLAHVLIGIDRSQLCTCGNKLRGFTV